MVPQNQTSDLGTGASYSHLGTTLSRIFLTPKCSIETSTEMSNGNGETAHTKDDAGTGKGNVFTSKSYKR